MAMNSLNTSIIAKEMQTKVTERMGDWFEAEFKAKANAAARRTRLIRSHGHTYTYARYQNTGQLARNLKQVKKGDKVVVKQVLELIILMVIMVCISWLKKKVLKTLKQH